MKLKKFAAIFMVVMTIMSIMSILPMALTMVNAAEVTDNIVWESNPDMILYDDNKSVNAFSGTNEAKYDILKKFDNNGAFYSVCFSETGKGSVNNCAIARSPIDYENESFGWLNNKGVLSAIAPYLYITFEYRVSCENPLPSDTVLSVNAIHDNGTKIAELAKVNISGSNSWVKYDTSKIISSSFGNSWKSAYISFSISSSSGNLIGTQTVDIKSIALILNDNDKSVINTALNKVTGIANINNFTKGIYVSGNKGKKNYYDLFKAYDENTCLSQNNYSDSYKVYASYAERCDLALSRTLAEGYEETAISNMVIVKVKPDTNYNIKQVIATKKDGTVIVAKVKKKNSEYTFSMPQSDVTISASVVYEEERELAFLWKNHPASYHTNPKYHNANVGFSIVDGGNQSAYRFVLEKNTGEVRISGNENTNVTAQRYYDTSHFYTSIKLVTESEDRTVKIGISDGMVYEATIPETEGFTSIEIPLKDISKAGNFDYFRVFFDNRQVGDEVYIGETFVFNKKIEGTVDDAWQKIFDMSDYTKSETNTLLGVLCDTDSSKDPWCENGSTVGNVLKWDIAWYYSFQNKAPYILIPNEELKGELYYTTFYQDEFNVTDVTDYIDTGYLEFYIYCDTDGVEIPISVEARGKQPRDFATFKVKYDKSKARDDGYMQVRIPFTYFSDAGIDMSRIGHIVFRGTQTSAFCDFFLISSFRLYSNLADVPDPEPIVEPEPEPERDIPLDLDSNILNAELDKENMILYVPKNTKIWEVLSALNFDTNETNVDFYNGEFIEEDDVEVTENMNMVVYRRGYVVTEFSIKSKIKEIQINSSNQSETTLNNKIPSDTEKNNTVSPNTGDKSVPGVFLLLSIVSCCTIIILTNRKKIRRLYK